MESASDSNNEDDRKPAATTTTTAAAAAAAKKNEEEPLEAHSPITVKPALKTHTTAKAGEGQLKDDGGDCNTDDDKKKAAAKAKQKHLKWDEVAIEEHDQLRGTRMKIDEPNTPYTHYDSGAESDDSRRAKSPANEKPTLKWDVLQNRLDSVAAVQDAFPSSPSQSGAASDQSDVEDERKREMRKLEFKDHRKRHYNEMELVRQWRKEHPSDGDDEDDDDED